MPSIELVSLSVSRLYAGRSSSFPPSSRLLRYRRAFQRSHGGKLSFEISTSGSIFTCILSWEICDVSINPKYLAMGSWRMPQHGRAVDAVRWLPSTAAAWDRMALASMYNFDKEQATLELSALQFAGEKEVPWLESRAEWSHPDRITALSAVAVPGENSSLVATGTLVGTIGLVVVDAVRHSTAAKTTGAAGSKDLLLCQNVHQDIVCGVDLQTDTVECVSVGDDGKICLVKLCQSDLQSRCLFDNEGLVSFSAVHWASPMEFVTAAIGAPLQWWDSRRPGGTVAQCPLKWDNVATGFIHSLDVHPSRKHLCVAGGSCGAVYAWDLRWNQEALKLAGASANPKGQLFGPLVESEVWEVKYDRAFRVASDSGKIPPVMLCSEDGVLAVIEGGEMTELLAEPCAINSFDIDAENGKDIICALEHESILYLRREL